MFYCYVLNRAPDMRDVVKLGFLRRRGHPETECMLGEPVVLVLIVCVRAGAGGTSTRRPRA